MATNMVIKVSADTKDAADKLRKLGYNVEEVKKQTDKATTATSTWDKALDKASKDNIKNLINLGAKFMTISTAATLAYKGIKSAVDEALKNDAESKKRLDDLTTVWSNIKSDFGQGLLDAVSPALETLYGKLLQISSWINSQVSVSHLVTMAEENLKGGTHELGIYSAELLQEAIKKALNSGKADVVMLLQEALQESHARGGTGLTSATPKASGSSVTGSGDGDEAPATGYMAGINVGYWLPNDMLVDENYWKAYGEHVGKLGDVKEMEENVAVSLQELLTSGSASLAVSDDGRYRKPQFFGGNYSVEYGKYLNEAGTAYWDEASSTWNDINMLVKETDAVLEESLYTWEDYYNSIASAASSAFNAIDSVMNTYYDNEIARIEESGNTEEDKAREIDEVRRRQFESGKANSVTQALIDTASGIMNIWSQWAGNPVMAGALTAALTATSGLQIGAILGQSYTGLAAGGIVSSPTHALIGEGAEKEAVIPLSKLEEFVAPPDQRGAIVININMADGGSRNDIAQEVYYAIERAQRTGLLPKWRYA